MLQIFGSKGTRTRTQPDKTESAAATVLEPQEPGAKGADNLIREYGQRITQALEMERDRLKEQAEQTSSQIIARADEQSRTIVEAARQESQQILAAARNQAVEDVARTMAEARQKAEQLIKDADRKAEEQAKDKTRQEVERIVARTKEEASRLIEQAKQEAKTESDKIMVESRKEVERIVADAHEKASAEAQQESARIIAESQEKAKQIVAEVIGRGRTQAKDLFARATSETRSTMETEMSRLLVQASKSIQQVIDETDMNIQDEFDQLTTIIVEAEKKPQPGTTAPDKSTVVIAREVTPAGFEDKRLKVIRPAKEKKKTPAQENDEKLYVGGVNLAVAPPFDRAQLENVRRCLGQIPGLRIVSTGGYEEGDGWMMRYTVSLDQPTPILKTLKTMSPIDDAAQHKEVIQITLKQPVPPGEYKDMVV